jgi:vesicle-associated membrane protein 7
LTEHTASASSNASSLVSLVLPRIAHDKSAHKTIDQSKFFIHCLVKSPSDFPNNQSTAGGLTFLVIAERDLGQRIPFGFLTNLEKKFFAEFEPGSTNFHDLPPYGCASFNGALKRMMVEQGGTQAGQQDALRTAQREIEGVREIMTENIERVLERGEHMSVLVDKTGRLGENARDFRVRSRTLKRRMWWKNVKLMVLLTLVVIFLIYLFVGFGCGLPGKFTEHGRISLVCIRLPGVDGDTLRTSTFVTHYLSNHKLTNIRLGAMPRPLNSCHYWHSTIAFRKATRTSRSVHDVLREIDVLTQSSTTSRNVGNLFPLYTPRARRPASSLFPAVVMTTFVSNSVVFDPTVPSTPNHADPYP